MIIYKTNPGLFAFFYAFKNVVFRYRGSILISIIPQLVLCVGCTLLARELEVTNVSATGHTILSIPLAFLLVFKSQLSYAQYWEGRGHLGELVRASRSLAIQAVSYLRPNSAGDAPLSEGEVVAKDSPETAKEKKTVCRLIKLFYFLVVEHIRATGPDAAKRSDSEFVRAVERAEALLESDREREALNVASLGTAKQIGGFTRGRPLLVLQWTMQIISNACDHGRLGPLRLAAMDENINSLMRAFNGIDKIDKMLFPFPYAQLVKIFELLYVFTLPFAVYPDLEDYTFIVAVLVCIGFYGIDQVSELLEDPFGSDDNDLPVDEMGDGLIKDIDLFLQSQEAFNYQELFLSEGHEPAIRE